MIYVNKILIYIIIYAFLSLLIEGCSIYPSYGNPSQSPYKIINNPSSSQVPNQNYIFETDPINKTFWWSDPQGSERISGNKRQYQQAIRTNDLNRLQKEVPFNIILPEYLPENFPLSNSFLQPTYTKSLDWDSVTGVSIQIEYISLETLHCIEISESNYINNNEGILSYDYKKLKIYESEEKTAFPAFNTRTVVNLYSYDWYQNDVGFSAIFYGYDKAMSKKIVESMIK